MTSVWPTHFLPMVPTGWALRAAGHEVRVAVQPAHADAVARSGLPVVVVGRDVDVIRRPADGGARDGRGDRTADAVPRARIVRALGAFVAVADAMAGDLVDHARAWRPDLVVHDPLAFAGPLAAAVLDVPSVRHLWGADMTTSGVDGQAEMLAEVPLLSSLLERFGVDRLADLGTMTLDPCPPSMQTPAAVVRRHVRFEPFNGPGVQPSWAVRPFSGTRICVTWGRTVARYAGQVVFPAAQVVEAAVGLGAEVVVATSPEQLSQLPPLPEGVRLAESVPLDMLLPTCSAIAHQGGGGTTMTALRHGVPQLVAGQLPDHVFHAERVAAAGVGERLDAGEAGVPAVGAALSRLLGEPSYREAALRVRDEMLRQPTPAEVVPVLERLARGDVPPASSGGEGAERKGARTGAKAQRSGLREDRRFLPAQ